MQKYFVIDRTEKDKPNDYNVISLKFKQKLVITNGNSFMLLDFKIKIKKKMMFKILQLLTFLKLKKSFFPS